MKRKLMYVAAVLTLVFAAAFAFVSTGTKAQGGSCHAQCRVAYDTCVRNAGNPGALNQCRKAYQECLSHCQ